MDTYKTTCAVECDNRNHDGISLVMEGARLPNPMLGQDAAFIAFLLKEYDRLTDHLDRQIERMAVQNAMLRKAIERHRDAQGHDLCQENDDELYDVLNDGVKVDRKLPPRCEFRRECRKYYESRPGAEIKDDGW